MSPLEATLGLRLSDASERWQVEWSVRVVDNQDRVATSLFVLPTPGFATVDMRSYWQVDERVLLTAGVTNIGNRNYQEHVDPHARAVGFNVYQPGVNFYFGTEITR